MMAKAVLRRMLYRTMELRTSMPMTEMHTWVSLFIPSTMSTGNTSVFH